MSMPFLRIGSDRTALVVEAYIDNDTAPACRLTLEGRKEAEITAQVAAVVAMRAADMPNQGVRHVDELMRLKDLQDALFAQGIVYDNAYN